MESVERSKKINAWLKAGKSQVWIAEQLGLTRQRVNQLVTNPRTARKTKNALAREAIRAGKAAGKTLPEIAKSSGFPLWRLMRLEGLTPQLGAPFKVHARTSVGRERFIEAYKPQIMAPASPTDKWEMVIQANGRVLTFAGATYVEVVTKAQAHFYP